MIRFWQRFFDPTNVGYSIEKDYLKLLEEIVRGKALTKPSKTTKMFAYMYQQRLIETGCLNDQKDLILSKFVEACENGLLDC